MKNDNVEDEEVDVYKVILQLRQENLLIRDEKRRIQELNELVGTKIHNIIKDSWITTKQRLLLYQRETSSQNYANVDGLVNSEFVDAKHSLGFQNAIKIGNLLEVLRTQPVQLAKWLIAGEQIAEESINYSLLLEHIVVGLYGCFIFPEDTKYMLTLLYELAKLQMLNCDDPRRIIKQLRTCSFKRLYFLFHEVLHSARFFLSAAMEIPIIQMMSCSEYYLDIDPAKTCMRFIQNENEVTTIFKDMEEYRSNVIEKLVDFTNTFVTSLLENVYSFPKSVAWIVSQISKIIEKSFSIKQANAIVTELIFTLYICPVILDPEQYGICMSQVTDIVRHNLIQICQILQSLALSKYEPIDARFCDLFNLLDMNRVHNFMELLFFDMDCDEPPVESSPDVTRDIMLFTEFELNNLVCILQKIKTRYRQNENFRKEAAIEEQLSSLTLSSTDNSPKSCRSSHNEEGSSKISNFFAMGVKNNVVAPEIDDSKSTSTTILVFPINNVESNLIGLLPEEKIIDLSAPLKNGDLFDMTACKVERSIPDTPPQNGDLKQSFAYLDEGSIGNTSDNLEAISEAASNHSVDSSIELENEDQNDNLSDMVSANVSGRGTPNISGRDTPSSQVCENDDRAMAEPPAVSQPQSNLNRQIRSEIDDKFCKFEIKKLPEGDETVSIISETWSTDVLGSDNEFLDASEARLSLPLVETIQEAPNILDLSETQSESAWSTDVMTSDTERLTEVDNDDSVSVAQSDDTRSETDDCPARRLSAVSTNSIATSHSVGGTANQHGAVGVAQSDDTDDCPARRLSTNTSSVGGAANQQGAVGVVQLEDPDDCPARRLSTNSMANSNSVGGHSTSVGGASHQHGVAAQNANFLPVSSPNAVSNTRRFVTSSNFQEYRKIDVKNDRINGKIYQTEQTDNNANRVFKPVTLEHSQSLTETNEIKTITVFKSVSIKNVGSSKDLELNNIPGPSGMTENDKISARPSEILLSNCSLNSSSSGSSSHSFENKSSEKWESKQWLNSSGSSLNVTLTPSESTSEMSVLSNNKKPNPSTRPPAKPPTSLGAIPKSISFDTSADKGLEEEERGGGGGGRAKRGGFFGKLRIGFRKGRGKSLRGQEEFKGEGEEYGGKRLGEGGGRMGSSSEVSDDILAKYRTKPDSNSAKENCDPSKSLKEKTVYNSNSEEINSFNDVKNKLRLVLSNTSEIPHYIKNNPINTKNKIETVLRLELGKARRLREWSEVARISEAIRCISLIAEDVCRKLMGSMREDIMMRSTYVQYLMTSRKELLFCDSFLNSLQDQVFHDKRQCEKFLATVCVREFLREQETLVTEFCEEFKQLSLSDEKCHFLHNFHLKLYHIMKSNPFWKGIVQNREDILKITLERFIMKKFYKYSIYPNGDGDRDRDRVLQHHISKLSTSIAPDHKDLLIDRAHLRECPWPAAQDALRALRACDTPRDKMRCVVHCAKCVMHLLALSTQGGGATADDLMPVLVYVIIKVNPEALLSTIQYVNNFFHVDQLVGEEGYYWTQFCAAVEYIKTMDYSD